MSPLRACPSPAHLQAILEALPATKKGPTLSELYTTAWTDLPSRILERKPPHLSQPELAQVLDFKLAFGQNRPALRGMIGALDNQAVVAASTEAFKLLSEAGSAADAVVVDALKALTVLRGVGPATASLVLSLFSPSVPFFSDEAAVVALRPAAGRKGLKYNESEYREFLERVREATDEGKQREWERRIWIQETARTLGLELDSAGSACGDAATTVKKGKRKSDVGLAEEAPLETGRRTRSKRAAAGDA